MQKFWLYLTRTITILVVITTAIFGAKVFYDYCVGFMRPFDMFCVVVGLLVLGLDKGE